MKTIFTLALFFLATNFLISSNGMIPISIPLDELNQAPIFYESLPANETFQPSLDIKTNNTLKSGVDADKLISVISPQVTEIILPHTSKHIVIKAIVTPRKKIEVQPNFLSTRHANYNQAINTKPAVNEFIEKSNLTNAENNPAVAVKASHGLPFWFIVLCAFFIPPLGVALAFGITDKFWICLILTLLFWLPGMIYAMIQILH
jgi:uncharacterized membrane protein YqaE (UPF0057 family)